MEFGQQDHGVATGIGARVPRARAGGGRGGAAARGARLRAELHGEGEQRRPAKGQPGGAAGDVHVELILTAEERPHMIARNGLRRPRQRLAAAGEPAAPAVEERRALAQVLPVELLLPREAHAVTDLRLRVRPLVDAPVADEVFGERLARERVGVGEGLDLRGIERALPQRDLRDVPLEVVRRRVAAEVGTDDGR